MPEGFEGDRVDQVVSRMLGLSRTVAAELITAGDVTLDGRTCGTKSERLSAGSWLEVTLPLPGRRRHLPRGTGRRPEGAALRR
ncbi:hypothetical protein GCM10029992_58820 [Glycomyces albus]